MPVLELSYKWMLGSPRVAVRSCLPQKFCMCKAPSTPATMSKQHGRML